MCVWESPHITKPREKNDEASNRVPNWSLLRDGPHTIFIGGDSSRTTYFLLKIFISSFGHGPVKMLPWTFLDSRLLTDWAITQCLHFILWLALLGNNYDLCFKKKYFWKEYFLSNIVPIVRMSWQDTDQKVVGSINHNFFSHYYCYRDSVPRQLIIFSQIQIWIT